MTSPVISVIMPLYNAAAYMDVSVASVLSSSFTDFELILADDGSSDDTLLHCESWAEKDPRIKVLKNPSNLGCALTRRSAIAAAAGRYIAFADSDDFVHPRQYEILLHAAEETNADIVLGTARQIHSTEDFIPAEISAVSCRSIPREDALDQLFVENWHYGVLWNKLYRKEFAAVHPMPDLPMCSDMLWNYSLYKATDRVTLLETSEPLYFWLERDGSVCRSNYWKKTVYKLKALLEKVKVISAAPEAEDRFLISRTYQYMFMLHERQLQTGEIPEVLPILSDNIHMLNDAAEHCPEFRKRKLILFKLLYCFPRIYIILMKLCWKYHERSPLFERLLFKIRGY